ncbi:MAG: IS30 family transposase [Oscillospiraceae bacterium]|jgi:IS30 family transposase|nr:IS30 family transposase [Oscillospiraceae bacterium]
MDQSNDNTKKRKWKQITEGERYKIEALAKAKHTVQEIATQLDRDRRTIEREIKLGTVEQKRINPSNKKNEPMYIVEAIYMADTAQARHEAKAMNKGRGLKIGRDHKLARHLEKRIGEDKYSPDAAIGEIKAKGLEFEVTLCTKTVYNMIDRGDFLNLSNKDLPVKKDRKKGRWKKKRKVALNNLKGRSIEERPAGIEKREENGHWEMDIVVGATKACLLVLTERKYREEIIVKLSDKTQKSVTRALDKLERKEKGSFKERFKSITTDNGSEFLDSAGLERSCLKPGEQRTVCYYAHPYSAYERGSNENQNKLIRRFIPKGMDIGKLRNDDIKRIELWMNNYPRRLFNHKSAYDMILAA